MNRRELLSTGRQFAAPSFVDRCFILAGRIVVLGCTIIGLITLLATSPLVFCLAVAVLVAAQVPRLFPD